MRIFQFVICAIMLASMSAFSFDQQMDRVVMLDFQTVKYKQSGEVLYRAKGARARRISPVVFFEDIEVIVYTSSGGPVTIKSPACQWNESSNIISGMRPIITFPNTYINGDAFVFDLDKEQLTITNMLMKSENAWDIHRLLQFEFKDAEKEKTVEEIIEPEVEADIPDAEVKEGFLSRISIIVKPWKWKIFSKEK